MVKTRERHGLRTVTHDHKGIAIGAHAAYRRTRFPQVSSHEAEVGGLFMKAGPC